MRVTFEDLTVKSLDQQYRIFALTEGDIQTPLERVAEDYNYVIIGRAFAVHPSTEDEDHWSITHIPTGQHFPLPAGYFMDQEAAVLAALGLNNLDIDWGNPSMGIARTGALERAFSDFGDEIREIIARFTTPIARDKVPEAAA
jgi:hypothetical protein